MYISDRRARYGNGYRSREKLLHSVRNDFTGLAIADLHISKLTVANVTSNKPRRLLMNTTGLIVVL
jgi:hypothetical protein